MENIMKYKGIHRCGYTEGIMDSLDVIDEAYKKSRGVGDLGMFPDGTGSEDPSERAYHNGMLAAFNMVDKLLKDIDA